jgi:hypothetical protein
MVVFLWLRPLDYEFVMIRSLLSFVSNSIPDEVLSYLYGQLTSQHWRSAVKALDFPCVNEESLSCFRLNRKLFFMYGTTPLLSPLQFQAVFAIARRMCSVIFAIASLREVFRCF